MEQRIGTCSICGGSVVGWQGAWWGVQSPPAAKCSGCGAVMQSDVIPMVPNPVNASTQSITTNKLLWLDRKEKR